MGVHLNRREPTKADYSNFALYQANQKTYEAVFLKTFITHALHPNTLRWLLDTDLANGQHIEWYLQYVSSNVNQIVNKMIWNAHSRTVNLLANDGRENIHFWDFQQFNKSLFSEFSPDNTISIAQKLNESWHKAFKLPQMIRYTQKDYPVGKHRSPFEEIDNVADSLFLDKNVDKPLATGRVVKPISKKQSRGCNLPGAAYRQLHDVQLFRDWLYPFPLSGATPCPPGPSTQFQDTRETSPAELKDHARPICMFNYYCLVSGTDACIHSK